MVVVVIAVSTLPLLRSAAQERFLLLLLHLLVGFAAGVLRSLMGRRIGNVGPLRRCSFPLPVTILVGLGGQGKLGLGGPRWGRKRAPLSSIARASRFGLFRQRLLGACGSAISAWFLLLVLAGPLCGTIGLIVLVHHPARITVIVARFGSSGWLCHGSRIAACGRCPFWHLGDLSGDEPFCYPGPISRLQDDRRRGRFLSLISSSGSSSGTT